MVRVFVCASSSADLARLEALIRSAPSLQLVGSSVRGAGLAGLIQEARPDVLLEHFLSADSADIDEAHPPRVALVSEAEFSEALSVFDAQDPPLRGILPVWANETEVQKAIEAVAAGLLVLHPDVAVASHESHEAPEAPDQSPLSPREQEILNLLAAGLGNKQIAWQLKISEHTVKFHITSLFNKLNVSSRAEAVATGMRRGLIIL